MTDSKSRQFVTGPIDRAFDFYRPKAPLSRFVDSMWLCRGNQRRHKPERILPTGTLELAINLKQDELRFCDAGHSETPSRFSAAVVSGASSHGFAPDPDDEVFIIGVHFRPGGAYPFLGMPLNEIADTHVDLRTVWGRSADDLRESLCDADSNATRFRLIEDSLISRVSGSTENHYAVTTSLEMFANDPTAPRVREAARYLGLSQRRFIEVFKTEVGITPKLYTRIQRFQETRRAMHRTSPDDWISLALTHGYCDQSHFIREFVEFSGCTPTDYLERAGNWSG